MERNEVVLFLAVMLKMILASIVFAEENEKNFYPLDIKVRAYPNEIHYGDPCFLIFSVTNRGSDPLFLPYGEKFLLYMRGGVLNLGGEKILDFVSPFGDDEDPIRNPLKRVMGRVGGYDFPGHSVKPAETMEFHIRLVWLPPLEFVNDKQSKELMRSVNNEKNDYNISFLMSYFRAYAWTDRPCSGESNRLLSREDFSVVGLVAKELETKGYNVNSQEMPINKLDCSIRILPRSEEDHKILQEWYREFFLEGYRTTGHVFAKHEHASRFPITLAQNQERYTEYQKLLSDMETRTPALLARVKRTNELAEKILERAKQSNSTISQNMAEFIQLRGFLVDIRYAENHESEQAAFDKLVKFVGDAKDKELWIKFLDEAGFWSIVNYTHFKPENVEQYRKKFREHFADDFARIGWTNRP